MEHTININVKLSLDGSKTDCLSPLLDILKNVQINLPIKEELKGRSDK